MSVPFSIKENYIRTKAGNYKISYVDTDKNKKNYESIMITPTDKDFAPTSKAKTLDAMFDTTKEFKTLASDASVIMQSKAVYTKDKMGDVQEFRDPQLFDYLNNNLGEADNNTGKKPVKNLFINAENNNEYLIHSKIGTGTGYERVLKHQ